MVAAVALSGAAGPASAAPAHPNLLLIVTDDHGFHDLGAHGGGVATPNLDRLGQDGLRLERFYATPVCSVTRATLLTGRNPIRTNVTNERGLDLHEHTLPATFRAAGYQTFLCGKWHLGGLYNEASNAVVDGRVLTVTREGTDYQPQARDWDVHYGQYTGAIGYTNHVSQENGRLDWWLNGQTNLDAGWSTDLLADRAVTLLQQRDPERPVLLYLAFNAVHGPVSAPTNYLAHYAAETNVNRRTTLAAIEQMDTAVGRVLDTLVAEGMASNTIVVFFGDNGGQAATGGSNFPLRGDKGDLFDGGIHTPAAIRWPGVLPSGVTNCQQFVWVGDLFPTLCAAAGVTALNERPFDGVNLWPALLAATNGPVNTGFTRGVPLVSGSSAGSGIFDVFTVGSNTSMFKLIRDKLPGAGNGFTNFLFDILNDPLETTDLFGRVEFAPIVAALTNHYDGIKAETYPPYVGDPPRDITVQQGSNVLLWASTTLYTKKIGSQWRRNGQTLAGATNLMTVDTGVYLAALMLTNVTAADTGLYEVVFTSGATSWPAAVTSGPAQVSVVGTDTMATVTFDILIGRPTATSIAASVLSGETFSFQLEYAPLAGGATGLTALAVASADVPSTVEMLPLQPDTAYGYRIRYATNGAAAYQTGPLRTFHTQRARGSTFTFDIEADPHYRDNEPEVWKLALANMLADRPDFLIDLGDTFMDEKVGLTNAYYLTRPGIFDLHREVRTNFFNITGHSIPTFLVNGNHEAELGWLLIGTNSPGAWGTQARQYFYPVPSPGGFYSGATNSDPATIGPRDGYYSFTWGDAHFVILDPFWYTSPKPTGGWGWTLGAEQYDWLKRTLESSDARFKFAFIHHLVGGGGTEARGGLTYAPLFEWGGHDTNGAYAFPVRRPGWPVPIQDLLLSNDVQIVFHGHDHLFVKEPLDVDLDGRPELVYQEAPQPSRTLFSTNAAPGYGYTQGDSTVLGSSGHLRVTVSPSTTLVEYIRVYLPANEGSGRTNRMIAHSYAMEPAIRLSAVTLLTWDAAGLHFTFEGRAGREQIVQTSTNMALWEELGRSTPTNSAGSWTESGTNVAPQRFYRLLEGP